MKNEEPQSIIESTMATSSTASSSSTTQKESSVISLPENRFELELEFVQALASPAYLHFLATTKTEEGDRLLLQEPAFQAYLEYLFATWTRPEYSRFLSYPHALYFLELLIEKPDVIAKEWTLPQFRNFCHQQQFLAWQHRHANLYGRGTASPSPPP
jgi:mediator of RNA polymerase II transcription subunit 31